MPEFYRFFDSTLDDIREYNAEDVAEYFRLALTSGIYNGGTNLQVVASGGDMSVDVVDGFACINGYLYKVSEGVNLTIETAHTTYDRIDRIVIRWDKREESRFIKAMVLKGVEGNEPVPPAITREGDIYELALAQVYVQAGKSYISGSNVTDERLNAEVCGLINSQIQADTTEIFNQFQAWFYERTAKYETEWDAWEVREKAEFQAWLDGLAEIMNENVATNLQAQIDTHTRAEMPHVFTASDNKKYKYGFKTNQAKDGLIFVYEEVI